MLRVEIGQYNGRNERTNGGLPYVRLHINGPPSKPASAWLWAPRLQGLEALPRRKHLRDPLDDHFLGTEITGSFTC